jgi:hypothetical protein
MTHTHLVACPSCARHVRVSEPTCPFCKSTLSEALRETPEPRGPAVRLSRGGLYAFGVGALTVAVGCSSSAPAQVAVPYGLAPAPECELPDGIKLGAACEGMVGLALCGASCAGSCDGGGGYLVCTDANWTFTCAEPASFGSIYEGFCGDAGDDADSGDDAEATSKADAAGDPGG